MPVISGMYVQQGVHFNEYKSETVTVQARHLNWDIYFLSDKVTLCQNNYLYLEFTKCSKNTSETVIQ